MGKLAFIFPGQGAQCVGMSREFYDTFEVSHDIFDRAEKVLDFDIKKVCFEENDDINKTEFTQAAILTASTCIYKAIEEKGLKPDYTAGLSLGEFTALVANHTLDFEDAVKLVRKRGCYMENEVTAGKGSMAAVMGTDTALIEKICNEVSQEMKNPVAPANYNCPGQIVITGETTAVVEAKKRLQESGAKKVVLLKVSGPFHSSMLDGVEAKLEKELEKADFHEGTVPYVSSVNAKCIESDVDRKLIKSLLAKQVHVPVLWQQAVECLIECGVDTFVEIGPGKTLTGFMRRIDRTKKVININKVEELKKLDDFI